MENYINPDKIKSLTGIKVFALLLIFYQHSSLPLLPFGLGSREPLINSRIFKTSKIC